MPKRWCRGAAVLCTKAAAQRRQQRRGQRQRARTDDLACGVVAVLQPAALVQRRPPAGLARSEPFAAHRVFNVLSTFATRSLIL